MSVITGSIKLQSTIVETLADTVNRTGTVAVNLGLSQTTTYTDGTTAGKVNRVHYREFTLTASTPLVIDLSTVVCNDGSVGMAYIREILLDDADTVDGHDITYGGGTTPFPLDLAGTTPTGLVRAGTAKRIFSKPLGATGLAVSTNVNVKLDPGSNAISGGKIEILGHN